MDPSDVRNISVRLHWDSWQTACVTAEDLADVHWAQPSGAPRELLHATVSCARLPPGALPHDCDPAQAPHPIVVCILKGHTPATVYAALECRAAIRAVGLAGRAATQTMMPLRTA